MRGMMVFVKSACATVVTGGVCLSLVLFGCNLVGPKKDPGPKPPLNDFTPVLEVSKSEVSSFLSSAEAGSGAKLAFVKKVILDNGNTTELKLCYIDFSESSDTPKVHVIKAASNPQVPQISPDGNWVVYASGGPGGLEAGSLPSAKSSAYICKLEEGATPHKIVQDSAFEPRFLQKKPENNKLIVVFPTKAPNQGWQNKGKTMKVEIDVSSSTPTVGTPEMVWSKGAYTGGMSKDENYLCGGGGRVAMLKLDTQDTATVDLFAQACNASISNSTTFPGCVMYLTTQAKNDKIDGGTVFDTWQMIVISNFKKEIVKWYKYPDPDNLKFPVKDTEQGKFTKSKWHHCEWSNHPYLGIATYNVDRSFTVSGSSAPVFTLYQERIFFINLKTKATLEVLRVKETKYDELDGDDSGCHWPSLWVEIPSGFNEDSGWLNP